MSWFDRNPEDLAEQSEPAEALAALRALDELTPAQLAVLDVYLNHWVLVVLLRPQDREGILEVQQLCELAQDMAQEVPEAQAFRTRLEAFGDLLEGKRRLLQANAMQANNTQANAMQANATQTPFKLLHEDAILALARPAPYKQADLMADLKLSAGRVSQVLGVLEAQGKIVRQRKGKESWVSLPLPVSAPVPGRVPGPVHARAPSGHSAAPAASGFGNVVQQMFGLKKAA